MRLEADDLFRTAEAGEVWQASDMLLVVLYPAADPFVPNVPGGERGGSRGPVSDPDAIPARPWETIVLVLHDEDDIFAVGDLVYIDERELVELPLSDSKRIA